MCSYCVLAGNAHPPMTTDRGSSFQRTGHGQSSRPGNPDIQHIPQHADALMSLRSQVCRCHCPCIKAVACGAWVAVRVTAVPELNASWNPPQRVHFPNGFSYLFVTPFLLPPSHNLLLSSLLLFPFWEPTNLRKGKEGFLSALFVSPPSSFLPSPTFPSSGLSLLILGGLSWRPPGRVLST